MTFDEAVFKQALRKSEELRISFRRHDKMALANRIRSEVCDKISCNDCITGGFPRCCKSDVTRSVDKLSIVDMKMVIEWSGMKVPGKLKYLLESEEGGVI